MLRKRSHLRAFLLDRNPHPHPPKKTHKKTNKIKQKKATQNRTKQKLDYANMIIKRNNIYFDVQKCRVDGKTGAFRWSSDQSDTD